MASDPSNSATATVAAADAYTAIPLNGLVADAPVPFALHLRTAADVWVLYHPANTALDESHIGRLTAEGITELWIHDNDRAAYFERIEGSLDQMLLDRAMPVTHRATLLHGVASRVASDLLAERPNQPTVQRAHKLMMATSSLMLREANGFQAIRRVLSASDGLAEHSLTVGFLSMGLARNVIGADATTLLMVGLAGLLHDVGKVGYEGIDHDPEHTLRGAAFLANAGMPEIVVQAARSHHERADGSGFPMKTSGNTIPEIARIVGIVDTFDDIYSARKPRVHVFDALRVLAQTYRGCFEDRFAAGLVKLFR